MAGNKDLGFPKKCSGNLKEQLVRTTLRNVRSRGHPYVELREDGKKLIFFCTLCLAPCYSDSVLFDHLKGNLHTRRLATAQATLMKSNPWPFSDGVLFFQDDSNEQNKLLLLDTERVGSNDEDADALAVIKYDNQLVPNCSSTITQETVNHVQDEAALDPNQEDSGTSDELVIPALLLKAEVSNLVVRHMGIGRIGARLVEKDGAFSQVHRIWCEWLGNRPMSSDDSIDLITKHDFALVIFSYNYNLGRVRVNENFRYLLPSSPFSEAEDSCRSRGKKRKSFSDPEDVNNQEGSSGEDSHPPNNSSSKTVVSVDDDHQIISRIVISKAMRKKWRNYQRLLSERLCDICQQRMLPNKDVAALMNMNTGRLVCSSRNLTGAFHLFHVSCLIRWILLCEVELYNKHSAEPKPRERPRKKSKPKGVEEEKNIQIQEKHIHSSFCPECQGTGLTVHGEDLEKPTIPLSKIFKYKIKLCDGHKAWMKKPEDLQNCSIGFSFPYAEENIEEIIAHLKLLHFYRAVL